MVDQALKDVRNDTCYAENIQLKPKPFISLLAVKKPCSQGALDDSEDTVKHDTGLPLSQMLSGYKRPFGYCGSLSFIRVLNCDCSYEVCLKCKGWQILTMILLIYSH